MDNTSKFSNSIWAFICREVGKEGPIKRKEIAEAVGTSTVTVWKVLKGFERCKLIKIKSYNGPGEGLYIKNLWLTRQKEEFKEKFIWKLGFEAEKEYLRNLDINGNSLGVKQLEYVSNSSTTQSYSEQAPACLPPKDFQLREKPTTREGRQAVLADLPDDIEILKYSRYYRYVMEGFRYLVWDLTDLDVEENQIVCNAIGKTINGWTLGDIRDLHGELEARIEELVDELIDFDLQTELGEWYRVVICFIWNLWPSKAEYASEKAQNTGHVSDRGLSADNRVTLTQTDTGRGNFHQVSEWQGYGVELDYSQTPGKTKKAKKRPKSGGPTLRPLNEKPNMRRYEGDGWRESGGPVNHRAYFQKLIERHGKEEVLKFIRSGGDDLCT